MGWNLGSTGRLVARLSITALAVGAYAPEFANAQLPPWSGLGGNPQHTGISRYRSVSPKKIIWSVPVDTNPPYSGNDLFIHYGSPVVASGPGGTVIVPSGFCATPLLQTGAPKSPLDAVPPPRLKG